MKKILLAVIIFIGTFSMSYAQCAKPASVVITGPTTIYICEGSAFTLYGTAVVNSTTQNDGFTYSWRKALPTPAIALIPPTAISIAQNTSTSIPGYMSNSAFPADAGTYVLRVEDGNAGNAACYTEASVVVVVHPKIIPGVIAAAQTICTGGDPAAFTQTIAPTGGTGVYVYQWERSMNGSAYADIVGKTNATYDEGVLTNTGTTLMTVDYRRKVTSGVCPQVTSAAVRIAVSPEVVPGVISGDQTICSTGNPAAFTQTTAATGGTGVYTYQWQSSTTSASAGFTYIEGSTSATYDPPAGITATTYYRRIDGSGTCATANTNIITVTVTPSVQPSVTIAANQTTICSGTSITFTATPTNGGAATYQWFKGTPGSGTAIAGATNSIYTTTAAANNDSYYVVMTSTATCPITATATSNAVVISVTTVVTPAVSISASPSNIICPGTSVTFTATPGNGGTAPVYEWFINNVSQGAAGTNATSFTRSTLANGDQVYVTMTSNSGCAAAPGTATSNAITITVNPIPTITVTIEPDVTSICAGNPVTFTATVTGPGSTPVPSYQWSVTSSPAASGGVSQGPPSTTNTFTTSSLTPSNNKVFVHVVSNAPCASTNAVASNVAVITVNQGIGAGTIGSDQTICHNTIPAAITQLTAPANIVGSPTYTWEASLSAGGPFTPIPTSTGPNFIPTTPTTQDVYIRRIVTDPGTPAPCNVATSNTIHITVRPELIAGTISADETICTGTAAETIMETSSPAGGTGTFTYQWESSVQAGGPYVHILNATNTSYDPGVLNLTTYYRRIETSGLCGTVYSNEVAKVISNALSTVTIEDPGQTCDGDIVVLKCKATNTAPSLAYNWYVNNNIVASHPSPAEVHITEPLKSGDEVWVELLSANACANTSPVISNKIIVDLVPCNVSNSIYTTSNIDILMQEYVLNSVTNIVEYIYFWSITDGPFIPLLISGPNSISPGQQNVVYSVPNQTDLTYQWSVTGGTIVSGQHTNSVTVDWDDVALLSTARTTSTSYSISVTVTSEANKTNTSTLNVQTITTDTHQSQSQSGINVFPNPTAGFFNIEMPESGVDVTYEILDLTGLSVASGAFTSTGSNQKMEADFGVGMYQIVLKYNNTITCIRLSKVQ